MMIVIGIMEKLAVLGLNIVNIGFFFSLELLFFIVLDLRSPLNLNTLPFVILETLPNLSSCNAGTPSVMFTLDRAVG